METNEVTKNKVKYFYERGIEVHIVKNNGYFYNGLILEFAGDMIILNDKVNGATPIYFLEIREIEKRRDKEEK